MKGKSVRRRLEAIIRYYVEIPEDILGMNINLKVLVDVMFVNKLTFLVSVSKRLKFTKIEYIPNSLEKELARSVNKGNRVSSNKPSAD